MSEPGGGAGEPPAKVLEPVVAPPIGPGLAPPVGPGLAAGSSGGSSYRALAPARIVATVELHEP